MSEQSYTPGRVVWRELMTPDVARAKAFYGGLFGWTFEEARLGSGGNYTVIRLGEHQIGGMWQFGPDHHGSPLWMSYVSVPDVDAVARQAAESGGKVVRGPADIPDIGRFAVIQDFAGALIVAFRDFKGDPPPREPPPGAFSSESLGTPDVARAKTFYGELFGWATVKSWEGSMLLFTTDGTPQGHVADIQESERYTPVWMPRVRVERLGPMYDRVTELGGQVPAPLFAVPFVGRFALITDPSGGHLSLFEPARK